MRDYREFWAKQTSPLNRSAAPDFVAKKARENLFHLQGGTQLLDFGCGDGDLLEHYPPVYERVVGVDFSPSLIDIARTRIKNAKLANVELHLADDVSVWQLALGPIDRIASTAVMQNLSAAAIEAFLRNAHAILPPKSKVCLFDLIDPRLLPVMRMGLFGPAGEAASPLVRAARASTGLAREGLRVLLRRDDAIGYALHPRDMRAMADRLGYDIDVPCSMYYEYRYHAVMTRR
jgi:cyclopropane fatty-acyl-phospholipid synthase-like methyltransferase